MLAREEYEARKAEQKARQERAKQDEKLIADTADAAVRESALNSVGFRNHPDRIVHYTGWLQAYTLALFVATLLLFGATVITTIVLYNTDKATHEVASAALKGSESAEKQVIAMQGQLEEMKKSFTIDRAYVLNSEFVAYKEMPIEPGAVARFSFKNFGRTPAILKIPLHLRQSLRPLIPLPDHFEYAATPSPLSNYRSPGLDSIQTDLGSV
jgi:hypothetical protein